MTRKRTRENLNRLLSESCFYCEGRGSLKSKKTICCDIFRDLEREAATSVGGGGICVKVNPDIDQALKDLEKRRKQKEIDEELEKFTFGKQSSAEKKCALINSIYFEMRDEG